jgi:hypothetical protein
LDDLCDTCGALDVGTGERLHDWRIHSYFTCRRNRCGVDQNHSGTKTFISVLQALICFVTFINIAIV